MEKIKNYLPDILILGGILLLVTNYYFKITEYKEYEINTNIDSLFDSAFDSTATVINYDYIGFLATVIVIVGLYVLVRKYFVKK